MADFLKRSWAEIRLSAVAHNYRRVRERVHGDCRVMAIVKADAYGHGDLPTAVTLEKAGADWFGVSNLDEAVRLREGGITRPILILSYTPPEEAARLAHYDITQALLDGEYAANLNAAATAAGVTVNCHVKLDTGMSRVGFFYHDEEDDRAALDDIAAACSLPQLAVTGIFTHFAMADEQDGEAFTRRQFALFTGATAALEQRGITFALKHCCNSAATLRFPDMHLDMVRPGIVLYGLLPSPLFEKTVDLQAAMTLKTVISQVKTIPSGTPVSYGCTHTADADAVVATVPLGYADGYPRTLSNTATMQVNGRRVPLIGRICMDQCVLDVTGVEGVAAGQSVTVFGDTPSADEVADLANTIGYELICGIGKRVPRIYL